MFMNMVQGYKVSTTKATKFKFGIEVPKNANDAIRIDCKNGNDNW